MAVSANNRYKVRRYNHPSQWKRVVCSLVSGRTASGQKLPHCANQINYLPKNYKQEEVALDPSRLISIESAKGQLEALKDGSAYEIYEIHTRNLEHIGRNRASGNSVDEGRTDNDLTNPQTSGQERAPENGWRQPVSTKQQYKEKESLPMNKDDRLQCNGRNPRIGKIKAINKIQGDTAGGKSAADARETYIVPINGAEAKSVEQTDLRERLNRIYDKVLVVDNISIAKKLVEKLTNEYKHLVHACDTEACLITFYITSYFPNYA